jgi:asparagine synthase (glutamine-hydrolysing)
LVTSFTDSQSTKIFPDPKELSKKIDKIIWHQDEPFCSASIFAQWCVFEKAKLLQIPVMLDGQGADETHCGYKSYLRPFVIGQIKQNKFCELWKNLKLLRPNRRKAIGSIVRGILDCYAPSLVNDWAASSREKSKKKGWYFGKKRKINSHSLAREKNLKEHSRFMIQHGMRMLLHWEDRNSMAHSIESRVPFLDYRIIQLLASSTDEQRIEGGWSKSIIRRSMHGLLPNEVIYRKDKMGFVTPESIWAKNECKDIYLKELEEISKHWGNLIGPKIKKSYDQFLKGEKEYDPMFWKILCLNRWRKVFKVEL